MTTSDGSAAPMVAVVDDDPTCTLMIDRILTRAGCSVRVYTRGEDLLAALASTPPDVVCLDLSLPGIDGLETLRRLKATRPSRPVIVFTASADEVRASAIAAGAAACVPKTGGWDELTSAVRDAVGNRR